jgi:hypothetical protein
LANVLQIRTNPSHGSTFSNSNIKTQLSSICC